MVMDAAARDILGLTWCFDLQSKNATYLSRQLRNPENDLNQRAATWQYSGIGLECGGWQSSIVDDSRVSRRLVGCC